MKPFRQGGTGANLRTSLKGVLALEIVASAFLGTPAAAQDINIFQPVEDRQRPEYQSDPIILGGFEVTPRISVETEFIDNLFASDITKVNDAVLSVKPSLDIRDRREDRSISVRLSTGYETYLNNEMEDRFLLNAQGNARFGLGTVTRPFFGLRYARNDTRGRSFSNFSDSAQPLKLTTYGANAGLEQDIGDFMLLSEGRIDSTQYDGAVTVGGVAFNSGFRDSKSYVGRTRVGYSKDPSQSFYVEGSVNKRDYSGLNAVAGLPIGFLADRSSEGFSVRAGFSRRLTEVLQLDVNAGFIRQNFDDPSFRNSNSLSFDGNVFWSPTRLTTVQARASRVIDETSDPIFNGLLRTRFSIEVQHELRRNLIVTGGAQYAKINAGNQIGNGSESAFSASARYLISPKWSLKLRGELFDRQTILPGTQKRISLGVSYNF